MQLEQDEAVPADLLLLSAQTHPDVKNTLNMAGTASVDTAQLDGETNLKQKIALPETAGMLEAKKLMKKFKVR